MVEKANNLSMPDRGKKREPAGKFRKRLGRTVLWLSGIAVILVLLFVLLYSYTRVVDRALLKGVNWAAGKNVRVHFTSLEGNLVGQIRIRGLRIEKDGLALEIPVVQLKYNALDLLQGRVEIESLFLEAPLLMLQSFSDSTSPGQQGESPDTTRYTFSLEGLPTIEIGRLEVTGGAVVLFQPRDTLYFRNLTSRIQLRVNDRQVLVDLKYLRGEWVNKNFTLDNLTFKLIGNKKRLTLNQLEVAADGLRLFAHGEVEIAPRFRYLVFVDTSKVEVSLLKKFQSEFPYSTGWLRFYGSYIGVPSRFTGELFLAATLDSLQIYRSRAELEYRRGSLTVNRLEVASNFGILRGSALVAPKAQNRIRLKFAKINLRKVGLSDVPTEINGWLDLDFNTWNLKKITGWGNAGLVQSRYGNARFDTLAVFLAVRNGNWRLKNGSRFRVGEGSVFFVNGTLDRRGRLNVNLTTDQNRLDTLFQRLDLGAVGGEGSLMFRLTGSLENPDLQGKVLLDSLNYGDVVVYGIEGLLDVKRLARGREGYLRLDLSSGNIYGIELTDGLISARVLADTVRLDTVSFYNYDNLFSLRGKVIRDTNSVRIAFPEFLLRYQNYLIRATEPLSLTVLPERIEIENFRLSAPAGGEVEVRGSLGFEGETDLGVYVKNIRLFPFNQFFDWKEKIDGKLESDLVLLGKGKGLQVDGALSLEDCSLDGKRVGNVTADFSNAGNVWELRELVFRHDSLSYLTMNGRIVLADSSVTAREGFFLPEDRVKLALDFQQLRVEDYPVLGDFNFPFTGHFSGHLQINGTLGKPLGVFRVEAEKFRYRDYVFPAVFVQGNFNARELVVKNGLINFMNTEVQLSARKPLQWDFLQPEKLLEDRTFSARIQVEEDSINFLNVIWPELDILTGDIRVDAQLGGTLEHPAIIEGEARIQNGTLYLSMVENPLTHLNFRGEIKNRKLFIRQASAKWVEEKEIEGIIPKIKYILAWPFRRLWPDKTRRGDLELSGSIDFSDLNRPKFDLAIQGDHVFVNYFLENTRLLLSTKNLRVSGQDTLTIRGDVELHKGLVELDIKESEKNLLLYPNLREEPPFVQYFVNVSIPGNFYVRSEAPFNSFEMQISGNLNIIQEAKSPLEIFGTLNILQGKYFQFEDFDIREGRVEFVNPKELPELNLLAETKKYGFIFQLRVKGRLNNPEKEIRIFDAQSNTDVTYLYPETKDQIALLLFGTTFDQLTRGTGNLLLDKGQQVVNQTLISQIERETRRFIGLDELRLETKQDLIDFRNWRLNNGLEESTLSMGKYLTSNLYLEYKTRLTSAGLPGLGNLPAPQLSWEAGNQLYMEYRINRNWSVSTLYEKTLEGHDRVKIDISWRWEF